MRIVGTNFQYRFTFFQRQFLGHMGIVVLILVLISAGLTYYAKQNTTNLLKKELNSASNGIVKLLQKTDSPESFNSLRTFLKEQNIAFIVMNQKSEVQFKNVDALNQSLRNKMFIDHLRTQLKGLKNNPSFIIENNTPNPYIISSRAIHVKKPNDELVYLFVYSPLPGLVSWSRAINHTILYTLIASFFLALILSWLVSRNMSRSVNKLRQASLYIEQGYLNSRSSVNRSDELGDLSRDFNRMAERLEMTSLKLEQQEKQRTRFLLDVTHELRTPLTSIRGIVEGFKNQLVTNPEEQIKYFAIIEKETFRLIRLINELLDLEKIQSGQIALKSQSHNAFELLEVISESLEVLIEEKNLQIQIQCQPIVEIYGDYDRLTQILINLIKNSIQFTDYGTILLSAEMDDSKTTIEITDSGKGMSKQELELIWDRFYKSDISRYKEKSETGLGLSIVKELIAAHQGTIHVQSELGIGTTFQILFPRKS